jgi:polygalacturonase
MSYMIRKFIAITLALLVIILSMPTAFAAQGDLSNQPVSNSLLFAEPTDILNHWASADIGKWINKGLIKGYIDGTFKPDNPISRAEFAAIVNRVFGYTDKSVLSFKDVSTDAWYYEDISKAYAAGILKGDTSGKFRPEAPLSRQEAATVIYRAFNLKAKDINSVSRYSDAKKISEWSKTAISAMAEGGYISGRGADAFEPLSNITRAESVKMLDNVVGELKNKVGTYSENIDTNLVVNTSGINLKDMTIKGNLYITAGVGDGSITMDNVTVKGSTIVRGGGEHSIVIKNSMLVGTLLILKENGKVRIISQGTTDIPQVQLDSGAILQDENSNAKGFGAVQISQTIASGQDIILDGDFLNVSIEAPSVSVKLLSGTVAKLNIEKTAVGATIQMAKGSTVENFTAEANVAVTGQGTIKTANINANGVTIETKPVTVTFQAGITAVIEGKSTNGTPATATPPPSTGGNGNGDNGNGGNGGDNGSTPKSANSVIEKNNSADNIEVVSQGDKEILVAEGTTVAQLLAQTKATDGSDPRKLVTAENGEAKASGILYKSDVLTVTSEDASTSRIYKIVPVKIEGKDNYWDGPLYRKIENVVKENIPVFKNADYKITDEKYKDFLKEMQEEYFIAGSASKSNPQYQTVTDYTQVFKKAIEECSANGGGRVVVPAREAAYYTGAIHLLSNVNLYIEEGATVKFVRNKTNEYYPLVLTRFEGVECMNFSPFIYAYGQENIGITGKGTLDGQCDAYNWIPWKTGSYGWANQATLRATLFDMGNTNVPVEERILDDTISTLRPCFVEPYSCKNVLIEDFTVLNSPMWEIHPAMSENVMVRKLNINSKLANNDGVDPESCKNVIIEDCTIDTGDDCIAIKSGRDGDGRRINVPSQSIIVRGNVFKKGHGGVTMGSEMSGSVRNILIEGNYFDSDELEYPLRFKSSAVRGGTIENIYLRNSSVNKSRQSIIRAEMTYEDTGDTGPYTPVIRNIGISNFKTALPPEGDNNIQAARGIYITTVDRQPIENLSIKDCVFTGVAISNGVENIANVMSVGRIKNLVFDNVEINGRIFNLEKVEANGITADDVALNEGTDAIIESNSDAVKVVGYITTAMQNFTDGADVHVTIDKTASKATDTVFETMGDGRIKFTATVPVTVGLHTITVVTMAKDKYNMDVKVFKAHKFKDGNDIPVILKKSPESTFVTAVDNTNMLIASNPGLSVESLLQNVASATEYEYSYTVFDKNNEKKTTGLINSLDTLVVAPVAHPTYAITYKFEVYVEIRGTSTTSNTLLSSLTRSTPVTDFTTWSGSSTSSVPVLGTVRYVDVITKTTPEAVSVWFNLPGNVPVEGSYRAEVLEKLPAGNGAKVDLYVNDEKIGTRIDTQVTQGTDYTVTTNTFRKIDAGTINLVAGAADCKFVFTGASAASSSTTQKRIAVSYVRLYYVGAKTLSNGTVAIAKSGSSGKIKVAGTSTITVMGGTTVDEIKAQIAAKDHSVQTYAVTDGDNNAKASGLVAGGDKLRVTSEDGKNEYTYKLAIYDPNAKAEDGVYWNEDLYNEIDKTVNANTPVFKNVHYSITDAKYAGLVRKVTETFYTGNQANNVANKTSPLVASSQEVWYYTDAITAAIKEANANGGGIVNIPATGSLNTNGAYYSGAITLLSNVNLHIETGATVKFMRNKTNEYYPIVLSSYEGTDFYNYSPLIYALNQTNIAITGGGLLDGQEDIWNWRPWKKGYWGELSVEEKVATSYGNNGVLNDMNFRDVPITKRIFTDDGHMPATIPVIDGDSVKNIAPPADAVALKSTFRPAFIEPYNCTNVIIEGVQIRNTPFWIIHPVSSQNLLIRDLDIYSNKTTEPLDANGWNNDDGLDPESCKNVVMERNDMTVSDDGGALKAGRNLNGREHRNPCENIIIRNSVYNNDGGGSAAVSMGSEMSGSIRNVFVHDCEFGGTGLSLILKIKTNSNRGGMVENIYLRDCLLNKAISGMAQFDGNYSETVPFPNADMFNPTIRNIYIDNVNTAPTMTAGKTTFQFSSAASRSPVENVYYRNSVFYTTNTLQAAFNSNKFIKNFVVENVKYINPTTLAETMYNTTPLGLLDETAAAVNAGTLIPLTAKSIANPNIINEVSAKTFKISGKVDLNAYPNFTTGGAVKFYVDRTTTAINATLNPDGTFISNNITLTDNYYWYTDRHYVTVNFYNGYNINSMVYQIALKLSTETGIKLKASHANIVELDPAGKKLIVTTDASVAYVLGQIESVDGSVQSYAVKNSSDAVKASGALVTGDKLVVTAADGVANATYGITVAKSSDTNIIAKPGVNADKSAYTGSPSIAAVDNTKKELYLYTTPVSVAFIINEIQPLAGTGAEGQTYEVFGGSTRKNDADNVALQGDTLVVTAPDGVTKTIYVIRKRTLEFEEYATTTPASWTFSGISRSPQLQESKGNKYVQSSENPDAGAYMTLDVTVPESGIYNILMNCKYDTAKPRAVIQVSIDGVNTGDPFDLHGSSTDANAPFSEHLVGQYTFADTGTHTFRIMVTQATGDLILDYIDLVKAH